MVGGVLAIIMAGPDNLVDRAGVQEPEPVAETAEYSVCRLWEQHGENMAVRPFQTVLVRVVLEVAAVLDRKVQMQRRQQRGVRVEMDCAIASPANQYSTVVAGADTGVPLTVLVALVAAGAQLLPPGGLVQTGLAVVVGVQELLRVTGVLVLLLLDTCLIPFHQTALPD
jgi:galactitol-specific phosphotransferase system IIC component